MPFFRQQHFSPEAALLQLFSELEQPQCEQKLCPPRRQHPQESSFTPRFDVTETSVAYELFGEVAGLETDDLAIEFSDAQTLVIRGKTERGVANPTPAIQDELPEPFENVSQKSGESDHQATVEDEYDEADTPLTTTATTATAAGPEKQQEQQQKDPEASIPKAKYWVAERRVGLFARSFAFAQRIDQDGVVAGLKNGILHVVIPKSQKSKKVHVHVN